MTPHRLLPLLLAAATLVSACGSDDSPDGAMAGADRTLTTTTDDTGRPGASTTTDAVSATDTVPSTAPPVDVALTDPEDQDPTPTTTSSTRPATTASRPTRDVYVPPAGTYRYDVEGTTQNSGILGGRERSLPESSTDHVSVNRNGRGQRVTVVTRDDGADSQQETTVDVAEDRAALVKLTQRSDNGTTVTVIPEPPALLASLPYQVGDTWEIAWNDRASGISGVGTGEVVRTEAVTTPAGEYDTVVIHVTQQLRGTISGTLDLTAWIDRTSGIQAKQHLITEIQDATGSSRTEATRTVREIPNR